MYNTVGETAGVTQDVGSDPTVRDPDFSMVCCVFCGGEIEDEGDVENVDGGEEKGAMERGGARVFDLAEMSRMEEQEDEDEDNDEEKEEAAHAQPARVSACS